MALGHGRVNVVAVVVPEADAEAGNRGSFGIAKTLSRIRGKV